MLSLPFRWEIVFGENRQILVRRIFSHGLYRRRSFHIGSKVDRWRGAVVPIRNVIGELTDGIPNLHLTLRIYAEDDAVKRDEIAARQLDALYQSPGQEKFRLADVKRLFEMMRWKG
jgi:hypothetical protein